MAIQKTLIALVTAVAAVFASSGWASQVKVDVKMRPAGSFKCETTKVQGTATKNGDSVIAENVVVDVNSLTTSVALRDKHMKDYLKAAQFPQIKLLKAVGKGGKGKGHMEIMGQKKEVSGTYEISGNELKAKFPMKLSDLGITGIRYMTIGVQDEIVVHVDLPIK